MAEPHAHEVKASTPLRDGLAEWIVEQRWFGGKGSGTALSNVGTVALPSEDGAGQGETVVIETLVVEDQNPAAPARYQVPLVHRALGTDSSAAALDGTVASDEDGLIIDGPRDQRYATALLRTMLTGATLSGDGVTAAGEVLGWTGSAPTVTRARVLSGEQSNTSIIFDLADAGGHALRPVIVKVFRALHHGANPDVVLQGVISAAGSARVPETLGALTGTWPDPTAPGGIARGHLAVVQEFLDGTEDAWRVALRAARADEDFRGPARALGEATAEVHRILAARLGTRPADDAGRAAILTSMRSRAAQAVALVPDLHERRRDIEAVLQGADAVPWPAFQRVHGDYHLGQVLLAPDRGWVLLDFEGEPLRPMAERNEPDVPLRDVAGMLRSFDYVAGTIEQSGGSAAEWAAAARNAFLQGYFAETTADADDTAVLLSAFELDKALYECVYEVRNRPTWLPIPERAVHRLLGD